MVVLHVFIIKNHHKLLSNYYSKFTFWVFYPFYDFMRSYIQIHFPLTLPYFTREYGNFPIILE